MFPPEPLASLHSSEPSVSGTTSAIGGRSTADDVDSDVADRHVVSGSNTDFLLWLQRNTVDLDGLPASPAVLFPKAAPTSSSSSYSSNNNSAAVHQVHLYGCLQSLMKMHPLFDLAIAGSGAFLCISISFVRGIGGIAFVSIHH
jgi:hypothetical protein